MNRMEENHDHIFRFYDPLERELYFDTLNEAILTSIDGKFHRTDLTKIFISEGFEPLINSQMRLDSLSSLGKDYEKVYFTYIPAKEYSFLAKKPKKEIVNSEIHQLVLHPLIKLKEKNFEDSNNEFLSGYLSGKRSVIMISSHGNAIRLKGCGNNYIGFNLANVDVEGPNHYEIRGTQFKNTCLREIDLTRKVNDALIKNDLLPGNVPIGFWLYDNLSSKYKSLGLKNDCTLIDKYCSLYYTNGDKRLGFNFFTGLNVLFCSLLSNRQYVDTFLKEKLIDFSKIATNLKQEQFAKDTFNLQFNEEIYKSFEKMLKHYDDKSPIDFFNFLDYFRKQQIFDEESLSLENKSLLNYVSVKRESVKNTEKLKSMKSLSEDFLKSINSLFEKLKSKKIHIFHLVLTVLSNICYEIGKIKRILELEEVNWGTYDYHSNAHLDNFLLLPPNSRNLYLAPVDFDLAFTRDQFCDLKYKNRKNLDEFDFDSLMRSEKNNLIFQISGLNTISNLEVKVFDFGDENNDYLNSIRNMLFENNNLYFTKGYLGIEVEEEKTFFKELYPLGQELNRLILRMESLSRLN